MLRLKSKFLNIDILKYIVKLQVRRIYICRKCGNIELFKRIKLKVLYNVMSFCNKFKKLLKLG